MFALLAFAMTPPAAGLQSSQLLGDPNVLIIITDDQPPGTLKVMPKTRRHFVRHGTRFSNAFPTNPMCCPARATLMTGRYSHNNEVRNNELVHALDMDSTLQRYLRGEGYHTALYGKFLNRWHEDPPHFDRWGVITGRYRYYDTEWNIDGNDQVVEGYWTDALAEKSVEFLESLEDGRDDQPWLLYVSSPAPHAPYKVAAEYRDAPVPRWKPDPAVLETNKGDKPRYVRLASTTIAQARRVATRQMRMLMSVDDLVGELMGAIEVLEEENTIAFFVSDNGYLWGQHGLLGSFVSKGNPYAQSVKVPMMMRWPGRLTQDVVDRRLVGFIDILPTVLDAVGLEPDAEYPPDGRSLLGEWRRSRILNESWRLSGDLHPHQTNWASFRTNDYSYVEYRTSGRVVFREYYDLRTDPYELRNLLRDGDPSNDPPLERLQQALTKARTCSGDACP